MTNPWEENWNAPTAPTEVMPWEEDLTQPWSEADIQQAAQAAKQEGLFAPQVAAPQMVAPQQEVEEPSMLGDIATQAVASVPSALLNIGQTMAQLDQALSEFLPEGVRKWRNAQEEKLVGTPDVAGQAIAGTEELKKSLPQPKGVAGEITKEIGEFVTGYAVGGMVLKPAQVANSLLRATATGTVSSFAALDSTRENLFNLIDTSDMSPENKKLVETYLSNDTEQPNLEGRVKNILENAFSGAVLHTVLKGVSAAKGAVMAKANVHKAEKVKPYLDEAVSRYRDDMNLSHEEAVERAMKALKIKDRSFITPEKDAADLSAKSLDELEEEAVQRGLDLEDYKVPPTAPPRQPGEQIDAFKAQAELSPQKKPKSGKVKTVAMFDRDYFQPSPIRQAGDLMEQQSPQMRLPLENVQPVAKGDQALKSVDLKKAVPESKLTPTSGQQEEMWFKDMMDTVMSDTSKKERLREAVEAAIRAERRQGAVRTQKVARAVEKEVAKANKKNKPSGITRAILGVRERVGAINKAAGHALNQFEFDVHRLRSGGQEGLKPFYNWGRKLSKGDKAVMADLYKKQDMGGLESFMRARGGEDALGSMRRVLDNFKKEGTASGAFKNTTEGHLPLWVKDYEGLITAMGDEGVPIKAAIGLEVEKMGRASGADLTQAEVTDVINRHIRTGHTKSRKLTDDIRDRYNLWQYYADPFETMDHYVNTMSESIGKRRLLNYDGADNADMANSEFIGRHLGKTFEEEMSAGRMNLQDLEQISSLIQARLGTGSQPTSRLISNAKNWMYMGVLANPISAITQAGDVLLATHVNGIGNTIHGLVKSLARKGLTKEDIGIVNHVEDMAGQGLRSHRWLNKMMSATGFTAVDNLGKATLINGSLRKYSKLMKTNVGRQRFMNEYRSAFSPEELEAVMRDLAEGPITSNVKYVLWNDLSKMQPISMSEMPEFYLKMTNGRLWYALKSFTVKQLNRMYYDGIKQIVDGAKQGNLNQVRKGTTQLMGFAALLTAGGMSTDAIKDVILNRDQKDFSDRVTSNLWKTLGTSEYVMDKAQSGDLTGAITATFLPPVAPMALSVAEDAIKGMPPEAEWKPLMEWRAMNFVPGIGRLVHNFMGGGLEKYNERLAKEE